MAFTPPFTFVDATTATSVGMLANFTALQSYINSNINSSDIPAATVQTKHIVRPSFYQVTGSSGGASLETGLLIGSRMPAWDTTCGSNLIEVNFVPNGFIAKPYQEDNGLTSLTRPVNKTGFTFWVDEPSVVYIEYSGELISPDDHTSTAGQVNRAALAVDGVTDLSSLFYWVECDSTLNIYDLTRRLFQTNTQTTLTRGWHTCSIVCGLNSNIAIVGAVNALVEVINTSNI